MNGKTERIRFRELEIELERKRMKTIRIGVHPPEGRVRMAVPLFTSAMTIREVLEKRLEWIREKRAAFRERLEKGQAAREFVSGEPAWLWGKRFRLVVTPGAGRQSARLLADGTIALKVKDGSTREGREKLLLEFYRKELKAAIPPLISRWSRTMGVCPREWGIKRMKTRWGTCNARDSRIWLNLELAKRPNESLEYVLVHEMSHLLEGGHGERFKALMDTWIPDWRAARKRLNAVPLSDGFSG